MGWDVGGKEGCDKQPGLHEKPRGGGAAGWDVGGKEGCDKQQGLHERPRGGGAVGTQIIPSFASVNGLTASRKILLPLSNLP